MAAHLNDLHKRPSESGYALLELIMVMGIIAAVLATIVGIASNASTEQRAQSEAKTIESAVVGARTIFARQNTLESLTSAEMIDMGLWPTMNIDSGSLVHQWGGSITTSVTGDLGGVNKTLKVTLSGVPADACTPLATYRYTHERLSVNGTRVFNSGKQQAKMPLDVAEVASKCKGGGQSNAIEILFAKDIY